MDEVRVLFLTNIPAPYRVSFFNELSKLCELTVIYEGERSTERSGNWTEQADSGYRQVFLPGLRIRADARFCPGVLKYIKRGFDIVVVGGYATPTAMLAILALNCRKIPFYLNADGGFINRQESSLKYKIKHFFISKASFWLSTGLLTSKYFEYYGACPDKIFTYPFTSVKQADVPKEISSGEKRETRERLGISCGTLILSVGQFIPRKGYLEFLKTWVSEDRADMGLVLIGGGIEERKYRDIAQGHGNIWVLPFKKKEELAEYYKAADAFVLPTNEDVWGLVINEAMAYRLPVFSTEKCIAAMTMKGPGVNVFPPGDNAAIINALKAEKALPPQGETIEGMVRRHMEIFMGQE